VRQVGVSGGWVRGVGVRWDGCVCGLGVGRGGGGGCVGGCLG
jgi:hypothetical protein